jgi:hypothetical protein
MIEYFRPNYINIGCTLILDYKKSFIKAFIPTKCTRKKINTQRYTEAFQNKYHDTYLICRLMREF